MPNPEPITVLLEIEGLSETVAKALINEIGFQDFLEAKLREAVREVVQTAEDFEQEERSLGNVHITEINSLWKGYIR